MFHLHKSLQYYLYPAPVDMRKSFYTLSGIVSSEMNRDVRGGEVFIFINRRQTIMKMPVFDENTHSLTIGWDDLMMIVQSVKPRPKRLRKKLIKYPIY